METVTLERREKKKHYPFFVCVPIFKNLHIILCRIKIKQTQLVVFFNNQTE
jgi:hypothetical protein